MRGITGTEPGVQLPWLNELDEAVQQLNNNVTALACVDMSPSLVFDLGASNMIRNLDGTETFGEIGMQMVDVGFDAVKKMMDEEARLLNERIELLRSIQETLIEHRCDYRADLESDENEVIFKQTRPGTVQSGINL
jgi:hypothetical protein